MVGLRFQTIDDITSDAMFMRTLDIDMCGMGHVSNIKDTPYMNIETSFCHGLKDLILSEIDDSNNENHDEGH
ncbi:hypothetical protein MASR1M45_10750 [Candidatus Kapaibacterium sp.]